MLNIFRHDYFWQYWVVYSTPHALSSDALSPDALSPDTLSPRALSTNGLSKSMLYSKKL